MKRVLILVAVLAACGGTTTRTVRARDVEDEPVPAPSSVPVPTSSIPTPPGPAPTSCHAQAGGQLPDPFCTPGIRSPAVTQATIQQTICVPGYSRHIRPPASYTGALKRRQIVLYGYADTNPAHYEEDHLISLELGGDPRSPANLWPEPGPSPNAKDSVENRLHSEICGGTIALAVAQQAIATDWRNAP